MVISDGKIQVFIESQTEPLATAVDTQAVLPIKYFGFASYDSSLATFFYNCKGDHIFQKGSLNNRSPLQSKNETPSVDLRNCTCTYLFIDILFLLLHKLVFNLFPWNFQRRPVLITKCRFYSVKSDSIDFDYKDYVKLSDIANSQPDEYFLRVVLFIQGGRDANILLTTSNQPNFERDFVYEIGKSYINYQSLSVSYERKRPKFALTAVFFMLSLLVSIDIDPMQ